LVARCLVAGEAVALPADQRQAHAGADDVQVSLDLALAQGEVPGEVGAAPAGLAGDVLDDLPDTAKALGNQSLPFHPRVPHTHPLESDAGPTRRRRPPV